MNHIMSLPKSTTVVSRWHRAQPDKPPFLINSYPLYIKKKHINYPTTQNLNQLLTSLYFCASSSSNRCVGLLSNRVFLVSSDSLCECVGSPRYSGAVFPAETGSCCWDPDWRSGGGDWRPGFGADIVLFVFVWCFFRGEKEMGR